MTLPAIIGSYDPSADALYLKLSEGRVRAEEVDETHFVDLDAEGQVVGIEVLYPDHGVRLEEIAERFGLEASLPLLRGAVAEVLETRQPPRSVTVATTRYVSMLTHLPTAVEGTVAGQGERVAASVAKPGPLLHAS